MRRIHALKRIAAHADARRVRRLAWNIATLVGCLAWMAAGLVLLVLLLPGIERPSLDELLLAGGCAILALAFGVGRFEFRSGNERLATAPDAGFLVLAAIVVVAPVAAIVGAIATLYGIRDAGTRLERAFLACSGALAAGLASIVGHEVIGGGVPAGRTVVIAVTAAAVTRGVIVVTGQLLFAETRAPGGALAMLRELPIGSVLLVESGLPIATVSMAGPFLGTPPLALLVVLAGQLLTWWILRMQHLQFRGRAATDDLLDTFQRFVPHHVAREILDSDGARGRGAAAQPSTGGEQREVTVMFLDVRGFTSWSERTAPDDVFRELNLLLGDLADSILATDGTLDKFTGDGLMAFWNAPADQPDHATLAVQAIPKVLMRVREFNLRREAQRSTPLEIGLGIATGPAMVGNLGHRDRLSYTAIGDTVNLAARLEKATATADVAALIDERTFLALPRQVQRQLMRLDSLEVKGRDERVRVYAPVALMRHRTGRQSA
jgi:class 3 adenylate cyclase